MTDANKKICKKCLLRDLDKNEYFKSLQAAIEAISDDERTPADLYEERLNACKQCEKLIEGMCAVCGCFVELRAAKASSYCPHVHPHW